ncbi:MAG: hypothetical protein ABIH41_03795 [Nanoarchaeota archaeon]
MRLIYLLPLLLLASCVSISVDHSLHRDGSSDIAYLFACDSQMICGAIDDAIAVNPALDGRAQKVRTDEGIEYRFTDVVLGRDALFQGEGDPTLIFSGVSFRQESNFPFTTHTLTLDIKGKPAGNASDAEPSVAAALDNLSTITYTLHTWAPIHDANGEKLDSRTVRFIIDIREDGTYFVVFRELSFLSLFSSWRLGAITLAVVIILLLVVVAFHRHRKARQEKLTQYPSHVYSVPKDGEAPPSRTPEYPQKGQYPPSKAQMRQWRRK